MNREIKFRAIHIDSKTMVYGNLINSKFECSHFAHIEYSDRNGCYQWLIDTKTVGQFTGLKDKNGKEVWEGDIVKVKGRKRIGEYITEIVWEGCGFKLKENNTYMKDGVLLRNMLEIIGNIHENPELL